ncbi:hypothetical protein GCM10010271_64680 [Streptomyces kurssanovii]|nr:hypothetical protein GCM10010271_64680 [Streptomyces kurssanovii]
MAGADTKAERGRTKTVTPSFEGATTPVRDNQVDAGQRGSYPRDVSEPRSPDCWQQVTSRQDFTAYLRQLSADCESACGGQDPRIPTAQRWTNQSVDAFLWARVRLLERRLDGTDLLHEESPGRPGWRGPAFPLDTLRTSSPGFDSAPPMRSPSRARWALPTT